MATESTDITVPNDEEIINAEVPKPKTKNPKRVEQGKKLAEWNKKNKKQSKVSPQTDSVPVEKSVENCVQKDKNYWFVGGVVIIGGVVIGTLYFTRRGAQVQESTVQVETPVSETQPDDFYMA